MSTGYARNFWALLLAACVGYGYQAAGSKRTVTVERCDATSQSAAGQANPERSSYATPATYNEPENRTGASQTPSESSALASQQAGSPVPKAAPQGDAKNSPIAPAAESPAVPTANTTPSAGADPTAITAETGKPAVAETSGTKASPELHLPFSERTDVFSPPKAGLPTTAPSDSNEAPVETIPMLDVALKGFARVKDLRVLLQIEDFIAPLGVGQEKDGIRVVSINPPEVTLASGERQWTLSLSNQFSQSARPRAQQTTDQN